MSLRHTLLYMFFLSTFFPGTILCADYVDPTTGMEFIFIKGNSYTMGDLTQIDAFALPTHEVNVSDLYIGKFEVTFAQYDKFCDETGRPSPDDEGWGRGNRPVINVDWLDAVAFTEWLSQVTGKTIRLPSESEWEYAYRGGTETIYWWGNKRQKGMGVCVSCGTQWDNKMTAPVGSFPPNPFGLHDMTGNVYEWALDHKHYNYNGAPTDASAWIGGDHQNSRIARGGAWPFSAVELKSSTRSWESSDSKNNYLGLRVIMEE